MQKDQVFSQIGSPEFMRKYVQHDFPAVASIAAALLKQNVKSTDLEEKKKQLEAIRAEERAHLAKIDLQKTHNRMSPGSMYCSLKT